MASFGASTAICRISIRFFSPPEKPTLSARRSISKSIFSSPAFSRMSFRNAGAATSTSPRAFFCAFKAVRRNVSAGTPGISIGYWNDRKTPLAARSLGRERQQVLAVQASPNRR